jgi:hypothetical protein
VIVEGDDLYGDGVNIAARIEALADPGGVFVSNTVHDHVRDRLPFVFEDLGGTRVSRTSSSTRGLVRIATSISSSAAIFCSTTPAVAYSILHHDPHVVGKMAAHIVLPWGAPRLLRPQGLGARRLSRPAP